MDTNLGVCVFGEGGGEAVCVWGGGEAVWSSSAVFISVA